MSLSFQNRNPELRPSRVIPETEAGSRPVAVAADASEASPSLGLSAVEIEMPGIAPEAIWIAGFASLMSRLTRQDVVAITRPVVDSAPETFVFNLEGERTFRDALRQMTDPSAAASMGVPAAAPEQATVYEFVTSPDLSAKGKTADLRLTALEQNVVGASLKLTSPSGAWNGTTLSTWSDHLSVMVQAAIEHPATPVAHLPLWRESEAREFYFDLNQTSTEFPGAPSVPARFAVQVAERPQATAVLAGAYEFSYAELDGRSTELARRLAASGAGANRAVAVCMERTADLPMALLAVLKSGSFYVPLDPSNPPDRLRSILEECSPVAILTDSTVGPLLASSVDLRTLPLFQVDQPLPAAESLPELPAALDPQSLAYTIYTSGTTGKPKGVSIEHRSLLNLICSIWQRPGVTAVDRTLAVAPISFDIATMDMFLPICSGGTLVIASRTDALDPYALADLIQKHSITVMQATPATWRMMITSGWRGKKDLKMIAGGEALPRELANELLAIGGELWDCYGPTETTIYSSVIQTLPESGIVPVGPPIANTTFYVMDPAGFPVPPGVPGELYIGGIGVSPGYVNRPELTAERFVSEYLGSDPAAKVFRTGDAVRLIVNGKHGGYEFEFYGRLDHQVKLRGFRIELGEIETVLRTHPAIADAVVLLREDVRGEPRLVAYLRCPGEKVSTAVARAYAAKSLPEYMLPSVSVILEAFPLSGSGKIDRRALPAPELIPDQMPADKPEAKAANGELETKLLHIFREVLRNHAIGVTDSFFKYGGYSLLTVKLFSRIERELHVRLPITLLFDAPTVRALGQIIAKGATPSVIVPIRPEGRMAPVFIVQSYLLYGAMREIVEPNRPIYGVRELGIEQEPRPVEQRAAEYAQEILKVYPNGPLYLAGWCAAGTLTVEIARQLRVTGHRVGLVALFDAECPGQAPQRHLSNWAGTLGKKLSFHVHRLRQIPARRRLTYLSEALERNWDWAIESFYAANYRTMMWLQRRFGFAFSEAAFNTVYANALAVEGYCAQPYPGKLNLYRAADVPNFSGLDEDLGWKSISPEVNVTYVPGDHVSMFKKPNVTKLAEQLQEEIRKAESQPETK